MGPPHLIRLLLLTAGLAVLATGVPAAGAGRLAAQAPPDPASEGFIRQSVQTRWIHQDQPAEFVAFTPDAWSVDLSVRPTDADRELWLTLPPEPLATGLTWTDTVSPGILGESYHAVRTHRVLGDTVIGGRSLAWVRTDATVRFARVALEPSPRRGQRVERRVAGTRVGVSAVDPATGLRWAGADTAQWQGTATLHDTAGGPFTSGVRYEALRSWRWLDAASHAALADSLRRQRMRGRMGMLILPGDPIRERSLPFAAALERGDTAAALQAAREHVRYHVGLTRAEAELLIPYLDRPERLWRLGQTVGQDFQDLATTLVLASPVVQPDSSAWGCEPAACRLVLDQLDQASEPRLRDAALVGHFARDPAAWHDRLLARHEEGSPVTAEAVRLAQGIPAEGGPAVPGPGADWRAWQAWWRQRLWTRGSRAAALRLHAAVTGRDAVAELVEAWPPTDDSARVFLGDMLRNLGAIPELTADELEAEVLSGDPARIRRAVAQLHISRRGEEVPPDEAEEVLGPLLEALLTGSQLPWPQMEGLSDPARPRAGAASETAGRGPDEQQLSEGVVFLATDHLSDALLQAIPAWVTPIPAAAWRAGDLRAERRLLEITPLHRFGPFALVRWEWTSLLPREAHEPPAGNAYGGVLTLVKTEAGWRVLARSTFTT